jgi:hypothetical protein
MATRDPARGLRVMMLSAASAVLAPFLFVSIIVLRKVALRVHGKTRFWNKRLQHELARWT